MQFTTNQIIQLLALNSIADNQHAIQFDREQLKEQAEVMVTFLQSFEVDESAFDFTEVIKQICNNLLNGDENQQKEIEVTEA